MTNKEFCKTGIEIHGDIPFTTIGFKHGDIVRLKSGGHEMVVERIEKVFDVVIHCVWVNENMEVCRSYFNPVTLEYAREIEPMNPYRELLDELYDWMKKEIVEWEWDNRKFSPPIREITSERIKSMREIVEKIDLFYEEKELADKE